MSETLHSRNRARIAAEMQSGNNVISKLVRKKADTKTNTIRTVVLSGLGLNVTVAVGQQKPIAMNIKQRIIGTRGKQKGKTMDDLISRQAAIETEPEEDVKPVVHAHWDVIDGDSGGDETFLHVWETLRCSRCGMERTTEDGYMPQYCEDCGAKMDEKEKTNETD